MELDADLIDLKTIDVDFDAIIFDCDGTLVNTVQAYAEAWAAGFQRSGHVMEREWYVDRAGMSEIDVLGAVEDVDPRHRGPQFRQVHVPALRTIQAR